VKTNPLKNIKSPLVKMIISVIFVIAVAWILSVKYFRLDLTTEKRYTLASYTKQTLRALQDKVHVTVYLSGELNIPFYKMKQRIDQTMEEFSVYAGKNLSWEFVDPFKGNDSKATDKLLNELVDKGLKPANILDKSGEGGSSEKIIIPGAILKYKDVEVPVNLLNNNPGSSADENINSSIENFEFEFMRVITSMISDSTEKIAFIEGHGEFNEYQVGDISRELGWNFQVDRGRIDGKPGILNQYKAVIIAGPTKPFNEKDKFVLDQYILNGGRVLWFVDLVNASIDSIREGNPSLAMIRTLNIEDLLFRYGARINPVLLQDIQCSTIPVNVALVGNAPDFRPAPWLYSPLLTAPVSNPITRNLNMVKTEFCGFIDTIEARKGITKTALLRTSRYTKEVAAPVMISLDEVRLQPREQDFNRSFLPIAVLLEGPFETAFKNRDIAGMFPDTLVQLVETGRPSSMLIVSDADIIRNDIRPTPQGVMITPLGFDRYTSRTYGNKEFIVNSLQYMTGHKGLINLRSRKLTVRLLDKSKITDNRQKIILVNTVLPPVLVIIAGLLYSWIRKRKYSAS
jgi:ABC-2 type transport system permease protein